MLGRKFSLRRELIERLEKGKRFLIRLPAQELGERLRRDADRLDRVALLLEVMLRLVQHRERRGDLPGVARALEAHEGGDGPDFGPGVILRLRGGRAGHRQQQRERSESNADHDPSPLSRPRAASGIRP